MRDLVTRIARFIAWSRPYRAAFGVVDGSRVAAQVRRLWLDPPGTLVPIAISGWPAPVWMRAHTSDLATFEQIFLARELDLPLPVEPRHIVDGGANVGFASIYFAQRFPNASIVAVEFEQANYEILERNTAAWPAITPVHAAIRGRAERVGVRDEGSATCAYEAVPVDDGGVEGLTLEGLLLRQRWDHADLVKLDIEGSERDVLDASSAWLPRVRALAVETHDRLLPGCQAAFERAVAGPEWQRHTRGEYQCAIRWGAVSA
jgi:FkbM family methyltransferase